MRYINIFLLLTVGLSAAQRVVVAELFMRTTCPYCPYAHRAITRLKSEVGDSLTVICYHTSGPFNNPDGSGRVSFYGISAVPTCWFDGVGSVTGGSSSTYNQYRVWFNGRKQKPPDVEISISGDYNQGTGEGWAKAKIKNVTSDTITGFAHFVIVQKDTPYVWQTEDSLCFIERKMLPNYVGTSVTIAPGETEEVIQNFTVESSWGRDNCRLSVFLQTTGMPREISQAAEIDLVNIGIDEEEDSKTDLFRLGPNPIRSQLMIRIGSDKAKIEIRDCIGRLRKSISVDQKEVIIPIGDLESGVYYCRIKTKDVIRVRKFVKFN